MKIFQAMADETYEYIRERCKDPEWEKEFLAKMKAKEAKYGLKNK